MGSGLWGGQVHGPPNGPHNPKNNTPGPRGGTPTKGAIQSGSDVSVTLKKKKEGGDTGKEQKLFHGGRKGGGEKQSYRTGGKTESSCPRIKADVFAHNWAKKSGEGQETSAKTITANENNGQVITIGRMH